MHKCEPTPEKTPITNNANWDKMYSSFYWNIHLNPAHEKNMPHVKMLTGYSKKIGQDEAKDKKDLLIRKIYTLASSNGYLDRALRMEFYHKKNQIIDKSTDSLVVTLFPNTFRFAEQYLKPDYERIQIFLNDLYQLRREGKSTDNILPKKKTFFSKDEYFDISKIHFNLPDQLENYCAKLVKNGHAWPQVMQFRLKYSQLKNWNL